MRKFYIRILLSLIALVLVPCYIEVYGDPIVYFDKPAYTAYELFDLRIDDAGFEIDTSRGKDDLLKLTLTVREKATVLMLGEECDECHRWRIEDMWLGYFTPMRDDFIQAVVEWEDRDEKKRFTVTNAQIVYTLGQAFFDKSQYPVTVISCDDEERVKCDPDDEDDVYELLEEVPYIRVLDTDMDRSSGIRDSIPLRIWSDSSPIVLNMNLLEIDSPFDTLFSDTNSGYFEGILLTTFDARDTSPNKLFVKRGDTITIEYRDRTLPSPVVISDDGVTTIEYENVRSSAKIVDRGESGLVEYGFEIELGSIRMTEENMTIGKLGLIEADLLNTLPYKQDMAFIVHVKDVNGFTVSLSWLSSELFPNDKQTFSQSWVPDQAGEFEITVYVWEALDHPLPLARPQEILVNVQEESFG